MERETPLRTLRELRYLLKEVEEQPPRER